MSNGTEFIAYGSLVALYLLMSTGLAAAIFGAQAVPEPLRAFQVRYGWPGNELPTSGFRRSAGLLFGAAVLAVDAVALVGLFVTAIMNAASTLAWLATGVAIAAIWSLALVRSITKSRNQRAP